MLNKQGPNKIDWTDYTWNPISGCLHGCPYCYMLRMEKRFPGIMAPTVRYKYLAEKPPKEWADHLISLAREKNIPVWVKNRGFING